MSIGKQFLGIFLTTLLVVVFSFYGASTVEAGSTLSTSITSGNEAMTMAPGERRMVEATFLNTGTVTWKNDGPGYISLYTHGPKYRKSVFDPATWLWGDHPARISEASVAPGATATVRFELHAPAEPGVFTEVFHLASEDTAWIEGGQLSIPITVAAGAVPAPEEVEEIEDSVDTSGLSATLKVKSANQVSSKAGRPILFTAAFENTGSRTWNSFGLAAPDVAIAAGAPSFSHPSWTGTQLAYINDQAIPPGGIAILSFAFSAPEYNGTHTTNFQLKANGVEVPGAVIEIPVEVTEGSAAPVGVVPAEEPVDTRTYIEEPHIRVGVLIVDEETENEVVITSLESDFDVTDTEGNLLAEMAAGKTVTAYYAAGKYYFDRGNGPEVSSYPLRFVPKQDHAVMRIANWDKRLTRGSAYADNEFRHVLELRYNEYKERTWVINELGLDSYLLGLAETSESHHVEFNRAQIVAARSYAYFHMLAGGKRHKEFFDLNSTPSDQYYLGYGREKRAPQIAQTVRDTAGHVVLYEGAVAITPYYARSNGSTKDWSQVWWGDRPHVKGVAVPCDVGKVQWGHGVGMPQSGGQCMAEDGKTWKEILTYFYTGVTVEPLWK